MASCELSEAALLDAEMLARYKPANITHEEVEQFHATWLLERELENDAWLLPLQGGRFAPAHALNNTELFSFYDTFLSAYYWRKEWCDRVQLCYLPMGLVALAEFTRRRHAL